MRRLREKRRIRWSERAANGGGVAIVVAHRFEFVNAKGVGRSRSRRGALGVSVGARAGSRVGRGQR